MNNSQEQNQKIKKKSPKKRKKLSVIFFTIFCAFIVAILILVYTNIGVKLTVNILEKSMPELKITNASGTLNDLELTSVNINLEGINIKIDDIKLSLSGLCLFEGKICVKNFDVGKVLVDIDTALISEDDAELIKNIEEQNLNEKNLERFLVKTPLPIELKKFNINNVNVNVDDMNFGLDQFKGNLLWVKEKIYVYPEKLNGLKAILPSENTGISTQKDKPSFDFEENLDIKKFIHDLFAEKILDNLSNVSIPLDIYVNELKGTNWRLHLLNEDHYFNDVKINAIIEDNYINVKNLFTNASSPYVKAGVTIKGDITLGGQWPVNAEINASTVESIKNKTTHLVGSINGNIVGKLATNIKLMGENELTMFGDITLNVPFLPLNVNIKGKSLRWPLNQNEFNYKLDKFNFIFNGEFNKYQLITELNLKSNLFLDTYLNVNIKGSDTELSINEATLKYNQGIFNATGNISWNEGLAWNNELFFNRLELSKEQFLFPINIEGAVKTMGYFKENSWKIALNDVKVNGHLNNELIKVFGDITVDNNYLVMAHDFNILWADNLIKFNNDNNNKIVIADINLTNISAFTSLNLIDFLSEIQGNVKGEITIYNEINKASIKSNLLVEQFKYNNFSVEKTTILADIENLQSLTGSVALVLDNLLNDNMLFDKAYINLSSNEKSHYIDISTESSFIKTNIHLSGQFDNKNLIWDLNINNASLNFDENNSWQLKDKLFLKYSFNDSNLFIENHCWLNGDTNICLAKDVNINALSGSAVLSLRHVDINKLNFIELPYTKIFGTLEGIANISWTGLTKIPNITLNLTSNNIKINQVIASQTLEMPFDQFVINANVNSELAKINWQISINKYGKTYGIIQVDDPMDAKHLSGKLIIDKLSLSLINPLLNEKEFSDGEINADLVLGGSLLDPSLNGVLTLSQSQIKTSQLPVNIKSLLADINFNGKSSNIKGVISTSAGNINILGDAKWNNFSDWELKISIIGKALDIIYSPEIRVSVIPNLNIMADNKKILINGSVNVPKAEINIKSLPNNAVEISNDEIVINEQLIVKKNGNLKNYDLNVNLNIILGDKISVNALGFKSNLNGNVNFNYDKKGIIINGKLNLLDGKYKAYAQDLIVTKGEILFSGAPEQAKINIEAIRNPETIENNIKAGIKITGILDNYKVDFFSEPTMPQQDIISYIITGNQSDEALGSFLLNFATSNSESLFQSTFNKLGVDNLNVNTQGSGDDKQVVVKGTIFTPKLQVKYGVGILNALSTFTLRYQLLPKLYIEATTGIEKTIDLIYRFDF